MDFRFVLTLAILILLVVVAYTRLNERRMPSAFPLADSEHLILQETVAFLDPKFYGQLRLSETRLVFAGNHPLLSETYRIDIPLTDVAEVRLLRAFGVFRPSGVEIVRTDGRIEPFYVRSFPHAKAARRWLDAIEQARSEVGIRD